MYTVSDAVELGNARELILATGADKEVPANDDQELISTRVEEYFDE